MAQEEKPNSMPDNPVCKDHHTLVNGHVLLMGIVNVTPDSFSDGGAYSGAQEAIDHAHRLVEEGADIIDIGGESTRPGAEFVPIDVELRRVIPVVEGLAGQTTARISIDSRKAPVMREALAAGAHILNDVSALEYDEDAMSVAADCDCPVILMHGLMKGRGDPKTMQNHPQYGDVVTDVYDYLQDRLKACERAGIHKSRLIVDPGIGFGKTLMHNLALLAHLDRFASLGVPLLLGTSRKRFIGTIGKEADPRKRTPGSIASALQGVAQGVSILRVHDVAKTRQALKVWQAIEEAKKQ